MCPEGARLYHAWVSLVAQVRANHWEDIPQAVKKTPESVAAQESYRDHLHACAECRQVVGLAMEFLKGEHDG